MNKVYRSIYNEALGAWVATSEVSSACGKKTGSSRLLSKPQSKTLLMLIDVYKHCL